MNNSTIQVQYLLHGNNKNIFYHTIQKTINTMNSICIHNGFMTIQIPSMPSESPQDTYERGWFILSQEPTCNIHVYQTERWSRIWSSMRYLNCRYPNNIEKRIHKMERRRDASSHQGIITPELDEISSTET